jgi:hypothetical protein
VTALVFVVGDSLVVVVSVDVVVCSSVAVEVVGVVVKATVVFVRPTVTHWPPRRPPGVYRHKRSHDCKTK